MSLPEPMIDEVTSEISIDARIDITAILVNRNIKIS